MKIKTYILKFYKVLTLNRDYIGYLGKPKMLTMIALALITSLLNSLNYIALIPLASSVIDNGSKEAGGNLVHIDIIKRFLPNLHDLPLVWLGGAIIFIFLLKMILNLLFSHLGGFYGESYLFNLRRRLIQTVNKKAYEDGVQSTSYVLHLNNMVPKVGSFNWATFSLVSKLLSSLFLFFSLLFVSTKLAIFSLVFIVFWGTILMPILKFTRQSAELYTESLKTTQAFLIDEIEGREIIKIFSLGQKRIENFSQISRQMIKGSTFLSDMRAIVTNLQEFLVVVTGVLILCFAKEYNLEIGYIIAYGYVFSKFLGSLNEASNSLNNALEVLPPTDEVLAYIGNSKIDKELIEKNSFKSTPLHSLEYRSLSFSWGEQKLFDIPEFLIKTGEKVLIRGKNGEGKSTLLKLMAGLVNATGSVKLNDHQEVPIVDLGSFHDRISYIPQTAIVFDGMLSENILLNSNKSISDIEKLIGEIGIDLEEYFGDWKTYRITQRGKNLSGGEIQLIGCLRALVRDFDVIFIDEFANHLSQKIVKCIDDYLKKLGQKIILCVSHSDVSFYNQEYLLADGKLTQIK